MAPLDHAISGAETNGDIELSIMNASPAFMKGPSLLHELVSGPTTDATALYHVDQSENITTLSYEELHSRSTSIAKMLLGYISKDSSISPKIVPLFMSKCPSLYLAQLATLKAGAAFCPLNLDVPRERLTFILQDISAQVILTTRQDRKGLSEKLSDRPDLPILVVDSEEANRDEQLSSSSSSDISLPEVKSTDLAYIMYTSGSTGTPKAVCISHRAVTQALLAHDRHIPSFSRFLQSASPTFDVSVFQIFFPLFRSRALVSCDPRLLFNNLPAIIDRLDIDAAEFTPGVVAPLLRDRRVVPKLRTLLTIGEMLNQHTVREFGGSELRSDMLYAMYGPTEAAIHCTIQPRFQSGQSVNTIGVPLDTVSAFILRPADLLGNNRNLEILPLGEIGELAVGGHQLADGYLNQEDKTNKVFITHHKYGRIYRTGDKARITIDGILECLGRITEGQVKIRGQRMELGEVESAASQNHDVNNVAALKINDQVIMFCVVNNPSTSTEDIKNTCKQWLEPYKIPSEIVILDDFPRSESDKVDKIRLEKDYKSRFQFDKAVQETKPTSSEAQKLNSILHDVLGTTLGTSTDLAAAGLDSLKAITAAAQLRKSGYTQISVPDLLNASTITDLESIINQPSRAQLSTRDVSSLVEKAMRDIHDHVVRDSKVATLEEDIEEVFPCTPLQDAMLVETSKNARAYCNSARIRLPANTGYDRFETAFRQLAKRHQALRSGFSQVSSSISLFAQIVWSDIYSSQIKQVRAFEEVFTLAQPEAFLRPLRVQYRASGKNAEILLQIHHALYDQWSLDILVQDLNTAFNKTHLPRGPTFRDVATYFTEAKLFPESPQLSFDFWQDHLHGITPTSLPNLTGKSRGQSTSGFQSFVTMHEIGIGIDTLKESARALGCNSAFVFQAAYACLLGMYVGTEDVVFGTVYSGRTIPVNDLQDMFGPLLATLPSRIDTAAVRTFRDLVKALQASNRNAMSHTSIPLAEILRACGFTAREPLFDSVFVWQETTREPIRDSQVKLLETRDFLEFNLVLEIEPSVDCIMAKLTFNSLVIPVEHAHLFLRQLEGIVRRFVDCPNCLLADISAELEVPLQSISNSRPHTFENEHGLAGYVERNAETMPDAVAVRFATDISVSAVKDEMLNYATLNSKANKLAHKLIDCGVTGGDLVCIIMNKSSNLYIGILAILKTGAGYLPLVPETPRQRIKQIVEEARTRFCLSDSKTSLELSDVGFFEIVDVEELRLDNLPSTNPSLEFKASDVAYCIYTSGTTGMPKGVLITQENILSNLEQLKRIYPVPDGSALLQACSQAFDVSVFEIFFAWASGMCLCSATHNVLFADLENSIRKMDITHLSLTPTVAATVQPENVPKVQFLVTAGEAVTRRVHKAWAGKGLFQGYGPSETTNICTVNPSAASNDAINNIGPAFSNTSTFVLSEGHDFQPLPIGSLGELCFGGQQVFKAYQNMPELTAEKIIDHENYGRIYRSGDLGRLLADGRIIIEGRTDTQRKIRGQRIELGEISGCILNVYGVLDCTVHVFGEAGQERLIAFIIPESESRSQYSILTLNDTTRQVLDNVRSRMQDSLPSYAIPSVLLLISALPMTGQGKIDTRRLAQDFAHVSADDINMFPAERFDENGAVELTSSERQLATILADTLKLEESRSIPRNASLVSLGLDSLSAFRFSGDIRKHTGHQIDASTILKRPTLARVAALLGESADNNQERSRQRDESPASDLLPADLVEMIKGNISNGQDLAKQVLPCTPLQEAMLSASMNERSTAYANRMLFKFRGSLSKIRHCWDIMMQRHTILRTVFRSTDDAHHPFVQIVLVESRLPWNDKKVKRGVRDLLHSDSTVMPAALNDIEPPWMITCYAGDQSTHLLVDMHHALYDANAMSNLLADIEQAYEGVELSPAPSFDTFLSYAHSQDVDQADRFFLAQLENFQPRLFQRLSYTSESYHTIKTTLPFKLAEVEGFRYKHSVSLLALCQAVWAKTLSACQSNRDLCFGNIVSGRSLPVAGIESLVAPCFNTLPMRANLGKLRNNLALIKDLHQQNVDVLPFQLTSLRRIQQNVCSGRRLFDSLVLLQQPPRKLNSKIWILEGETGEMNFPCIIEFVPSYDTLELQLHFQRGLFESDTIANRVSEAMLASFVSCVRYPLSDIADFGELVIDDLVGSIKSENHEVEHDKGEEGRRPESDEEWSAVERIIRNAFSTYSSVPSHEITLDTSIHKVGIDSIRAIQLASSLKKERIDVDGGDVMQYMTPRKLASVAQSKTHTPQKTTPAFDFEVFEDRSRLLALEATNVDPTSIAAIRPCTAVQSGMLSQFLHSKGLEYFNHVAWDLGTFIDAERLVAAWQTVVTAHEMLRTGFMETEDRRHSFAMITYRPGAHSVPEQQLDMDRSATFAAFDNAARDSVLTALHRPAWRFRTASDKQTTQLQLSIHHALYDAETLRYILKDLHSALIGESLPHRPSIDSALNHILHNAGHRTESRQMFWLDQLKAFEAHRFPNMNPVVPEQTSNSVVETPCPISLTKLEAHCRDMEISVQAVGQAAWAKVLAAYTGESAITFGVVLSGRSVSETTAAAFPCINTVPVCCTVAEDDTALIDHFMDFNSAVQKHAFTPLTDIRRYVGASSEALFDTIFAYQKPNDDAIVNDEWKLVHEKAQVDSGISIELEYLSKSRLQLRLTFDTGLLPVEQAQIMLKQVGQTIMDLVEQPHSELRNQQDKQSLLSMVPVKDPLISSKFETLHQIIEDSVSRYSERIAQEFVTELEDGSTISKQWTYRELDDEANRIAHMLHQHGCRPGDIVAMSLDKCPEAAFVFLGIVKAGCAFLAIDFTAPAARKKFILDDSRANVLLTTTGIASELSAITSTRVIDIMDNARSVMPTSPVTGIRCTSDMVCYVLYTSGTTGTPKGCEITHENVVQLILVFQRLFAGRWTEHSRWLQFASYHFDVTVVELFWTWSVGMRLVGAPRDLMVDIPAFINLHKITHMDLTPSLGKELEPEALPSLHSGVYINGGEPVTPGIIRKWGRYGCLFNFYGPTECTIGVTVFPNLPSNGRPSNIGRQFDNVGTCVMAPNSQEFVLRGGVGELCIFGKLVGKGYLNRPDLSQKQFPFVEHLGERMYRTGDLVRMLHDNSFEFLGRADTQVKLRGQRFEIDEIISAMKGDGYVKDAVCMLAKHDEQQNSQQLVSFITTSSSRKQGHPVLLPAESTKWLVQSARSVCEQKLNRYSVPTHFFPVERIPLSINNKQDDKALKALFQSLTHSQIQEYAAKAEERRPLNKPERAVARAINATLQINVDDIFPTSDIFGLGIDSITTMQLARRLKSEGFEHANRAIVAENRTIGRLAQALSKTSSKEANEVAAAKQMMAGCQQRYLSTVSRALSLGNDKIEAIAPCTPLQQGILFRSLSSEVGLYFNSFAYKLHDTDLSRLRKAFQQLIEETPILRTSFVETEDGHLQVVKNRLAGSLWTEAHAGKGARPTDMLKHYKQKWMKDNAARIVEPFNLVLVRSSTETLLQVHIHHALYDGISYDLLLDRLVAIYDDRPVDCRSISFLEALPYGPLRSLPGAQGFWEEHLWDAHLGRLSPRGNDLLSKDTLLSSPLANTESLESIRKDLGVTLQAIMQAIWLTTLSKYHQGPIGTVVSGRSLEVDVEYTIGPLFNTIPFSWSITDKDSWEALARRCHEYNMAALPFQHTPLRDISKWLGHSSTNPLFESLFVFLQARETNETSTTRLWEPLKDDGDFSADYPLAFEAEQGLDSSIQITIAADGSYFTGTQVQDMINEFTANLVAFRFNNSANIASCVGREFRAEVKTNNTMSLPDMNGVENFEWTTEASIIRKHVAALASVDESEIDEHMSVFSYGLASNDLIMLSRRLKDDNLSLPLSSIWRAQTIPRMIRELRPSNNGGKAKKRSAITPKLQARLEGAVSKSDLDEATVERVLPASPLQEALIADMLRTEYSDYFNHDVLRLHDSTDDVRLENAWDTVIQSSPILRTAFIPLDDADLDMVFAQIILKHQKLRFQQVDLNGEESLERLISRITEEVLKTPASRPPLRLSFVRQQDHRYMILSIAHALYDGFSLGLLHDDVSAAYHDSFTIRPSYDAVLDRAMRSSDNEAMRFWQGLLSGSKQTVLGKQSPQLDKNYTNRFERTSTLSAQDIAAFCRKEGITAQALCQTAWSLLLAQCAQLLDVVYGLVLAGRDLPEAEQVMFPTMNTIVMRSVLQGTRRDMLRYVQGTISDVMPYQQTPLRKIQAAARTTDDYKDESGMSSLFNTLFIFQTTPDDSGNKHEPLYESVGGASEVEYPVAVEAEIIEDTLIWRTACKTSVFDAEQTQHLLEQLDLVLQSLFTHPAKPTLDFSDDGVSICGLPAFRHEASEDSRPAASTEISADEDADPDDWSTVESSVRQIVAKFAKVPENEITKTTKVQHLGIDSVSAYKLLPLFKAKNMKIGLLEIMQTGSVAAIAARVDRNQGRILAHKTEQSDAAVRELITETKFKASDLGFTTSDVDKILPATAGQVYLISNWLNTNGQLFYPEFRYKLKGLRKQQILHETWEKLVARHEILRTVFVNTEDADVPVLQVVLKSSDEIAAGRSLVQLRTKETGDGVLIGLKIHHALYDAISLPLLIQDLENLSRGEEIRQTSTSFTDYLSLGASQKDQREKFWSTYLGGIEEHKLLAPEISSSRRIEAFHPSCLEADRIESHARKEGVSLQALFFAAYAKVYAHLCQRSTSSDVVFGIYLANRSQLDNLYELAAPTLNVVPLRVRKTVSTDLLASAKAVQEDLQNISSAANSQVGLWEIERWTGVKIDTFVNFIKLPDQDEAHADKQSETIKIEEVEDGRQSERRALAHEIPDTSDFSPPEGLQDLWVRHSYPASFDIEATVKDGALAIGVFGPEETVGLEQAKGIIKDVTMELKRFAEG